MNCTLFRSVLLATLFGAAAHLPLRGQPGAPTNIPPWLVRPMSLEDCLNIALARNADVLKSRQELEVVHGLSVQTRAIVIPKVQSFASYGIVEPTHVDQLAFPSSPLLPPGFNGIDPGTQTWSADIRLVQSLYEGGRMRSSLRTARLLREEALAQHAAVLSDTARDVRVAYYDVLLAGQQIKVREASIQLLEKELEDSQRRFTAGTVPRFNVLRAEVEVANARPNLSRARNAHRIAKNLLVNLLGYNIPRDIWEDIPLQLTDGLEVPRLEVAVPTAVAQALERRPELVMVRKAEELRREGLGQVRAGYQPRLQGFVGYGARKSMFTPALDREVHGWEAGVEATWSLFDGALTRGKVIEATAQLEKARIDGDDLARKIELEVRTAYSTLVEAWEVRESQQKVLEQADEALRLARARAEAGTGTQLDVLGAQTALTEARTIDIRAQRDYAVARARLERATGGSLTVDGWGGANVIPRR